MYLTLKALHVAAMVAWMAGMIAAAVVLAARPASETVAAVRRFGTRVTTPAMILTLALGLYLAVDGGWFRSPWLHGKLLLVVGLTAVHGILSGRLRRLAEGSTKPPAWIGRTPALILLVTTIIALLVVLKPGS
ncbi:CopD family protein [Roseomonas sp. CCTCC AB2023176]|uniref:CopD family protein n=1 Tax=Roseomonas sp. CCTCC AB2023176 TaxID=3342640 RepID=UPI0035DC7695